MNVDILTPSLTESWDQPEAWKLTNYERQGGYAALRTALEMTCLRMLAFSPRRDALHPASLTALPPSMTSSATPVASLPGKRPAAESAALAPISGTPVGVAGRMPAHSTARV